MTGFLLLLKAGRQATGEDKRRNQELRGPLVGAWALQTGALGVGKSERGQQTHRNDQRGKERLRVELGPRPQDRHDNHLGTRVHNTQRKGFERRDEEEVRNVLKRTLY